VGIQKFHGYNIAMLEHAGEELTSVTKELTGDYTVEVFEEDGIIDVIKHF